MEHESFEHDDVADILNHNFVSIKVDREERPDVDKTYMLFVQATTGSGGWPMSVFLTVCFFCCQSWTVDVVAGFESCIWWNLFSERRSIW